MFGLMVGLDQSILLSHNDEIFLGVHYALFIWSSDGQDELVVGVYSYIMKRSVFPSTCGDGNNDVNTY